MVREIEFRAKTSSEVSNSNHKKDGVWVYGFYRDRIGLPTISEFDIYCADYIDYEVDRNTLGQYTGLKDKNGTKIFEGDIVELYCIRTYCGRQVSKYDIPTKCRVVVKFIKCWNGYGVGFMFDYNNKFNESVCQPIGNEQNERELWKRAIGEFVYDECHKKHGHPKWIWKDHIEVIGNIHDNPELLGEENE